MARFALFSNRTFPLKLKEFSPDTDPQTQTYQVVMVMSQPEDINVLPGMTVTVDGDPGPLYPDNSRIVIPAIAVTRDADKKPYVWILNEKEMTVTKVIVQIGEMTGSDGIVISGGLLGGEKVVTAGVAKPTEGMKVGIWNVEN